MRPRRRPLENRRHLGETRRRHPAAGLVACKGLAADVDLQYLAGCYR
jgi:hypothetical protein